MRSSVQLQTRLMPKRFYKHKLLLDENLPKRQYFPLTNSHFDLKHIAADYKESGLTDLKVYERAVEEERIVVTNNIKDFKELANLNKKAGVIGITPNLSTGDIDKKLTALLRKTTPKELYGKYTSISEKRI